MNTSKRPNIIKMQWHITERCNLRCAHCYQYNYDFEMGISDAQKLIKQYCSLIKKLSLPTKKCFLTVTGGEPLMHSNFFQIAKILGKNSDKFNWMLLTNGVLCDEKIVSNLKKTKIAGVQVSLEGLELTNNAIRGQGTYKAIFRTIMLLKNQGITTSVSLTATKKNANDILKLALVLNKHNVDYFLVRRFLKKKENKTHDQLALSDDETLFLYRELENFTNSRTNNQFRMKIPPACDNALFWKNKGEGYYCPVRMKELVAVCPNGEVYPCRRLPVSIGNIHRDDLEKIHEKYENDGVALNGIFPDYCRHECLLYNKCYGGAMCINYALGDSFSSPDSQCLFC